MTTALFEHPSSDTHVTPPGHPERVARLEAVRAALNGLDLDRRECPAGDEADVLRCHPIEYIAKVKAAIPATSYASLDADTHVAPGSLTAAMHAVGGMAAAVDAVMAGEVANAFVACRPPGHHAETETAMGFCLFGTAAIGAVRALEVAGAKRVAVLDFDVHHGNGTQALLQDDPRALVVTSQQMPLWPGTGEASDRGPHGTVLNLPLASGTDGNHAIAEYRTKVLPALHAHAPDLILISAGFDAHQDDPLAQLNWSADTYTTLTDMLCDAAQTLCGGRVVSVLEGGYDLDALAACARAHVQSLMKATT